MDVCGHSGWMGVCVWTCLSLSSPIINAVCCYRGNLGPDGGGLPSR